MDPALLCRLFFTSGAVVAIGGTLVPSFQENIMNYGSRKRSTSVAPNSSSNHTVQGILDWAASLQVPHTWFIHYYAVSVISSIFWGLQIMLHGKVFQLLASYSKPTNSSMTTNQVVLAWGLVFIHGLRRLYECITLTKPSESKMWIGLWLIGTMYYIVIGISLWIDGANAINMDNPLSKIALSMPSTKTALAIPTFLLASWVQNTCHRHLADLKKYTNPHHPFFKMVLCPHYTSECFIYLALAIISAPYGRTLNATVSAGLLFVASNLAVTADSTWNWYLEKFGQEAVRNRWRMIPFVY